MSSSILVYINNKDRGCIQYASKSLTSCGKCLQSCYGNEKKRDLDTFHYFLNHINTLSVCAQERPVLEVSPFNSLRGCK